ncbi:hypothetical protein [uncultured Jatrophihabitans sp.]|uniref:hypothetical protein n=1 Tax=uncultured Jatrophihabitans sp. TaxID=1610747 RepID=UPI0035CC0601
MSAQNRVTPDGQIVATDVRGAWLGNRGLLHGRDGSRRIVRASASTRWITCELSFRSRRVPQWAPKRYTPVFFLDEAVALAAGHRPCAECRRAAFLAYCAAWASGGSVPRAPALDIRLAAERGRTHRAPWADLPTGTFVVDNGHLALVRDDHLLDWDTQRYGYGPRRRRPTNGTTVVQTPAATVGVLQAGYPVQLDACATRGLS